MNSKIRRIVITNLQFSQFRARSDGGLETEPSAGVKREASLAGFRAESLKLSSLLKFTSLKEAVSEPFRSDSSPWATAKAAHVIPTCLIHLSKWSLYFYTIPLPVPVLTCQSSQNPLLVWRLYHQVQCVISLAATVTCEVVFLAAVVRQEVRRETNSLGGDQNQGVDKWYTQRICSALSKFPWKKFPRSKYTGEQIPCYTDTRPCILHRSQLHCAHCTDDIRLVVARDRMSVHPACFRALHACMPKHWGSKASKNQTK